MCKRSNVTTTSYTNYNNSNKIIHLITRHACVYTHGIRPDTCCAHVHCNGDNNYYIKQFRTPPLRARKSQTYCFPLFLRPRTFSSSDACSAASHKRFAPVYYHAKRARARGVREVGPGRKTTELRSLPRRDRNASGRNARGRRRKHRDAKPSGTGEDVADVEPVVAARIEYGKHKLPYRRHGNR